MSVVQSRNINCGINLGLLHRGVGTGQRPVFLLNRDLGDIDLWAGQAGYRTDPQVAAIRTTIAGQPPISALPSVVSLLESLKAQAVPQNGQHAMCCGIVLGELQQGTLDGTMPIPFVQQQLGIARTHATNAGFIGVNDLINPVIARPRNSSKDFYPDITYITGIFQGQASRP